MLFVKLTFVTWIQDWGNDTYPPWAHGPGYILSQDIAHFVVQGHQKNILKVRIPSQSSSQAADSFEHS